LAAFLGAAFAFFAFLAMGFLLVPAGTRECDPLEENENAGEVFTSA
jgi:hypothetical protein